MNGIILIDKPSDFTSFDVVAKMKGMLRTKKIGHAGTLDPMATGVLPLLVGKATRAMEILPCSDKEYIAGFKLGTTTDTLDIWGKVLTENSHFSVTKDDLSAKLVDFTGEIYQIPPMFSAVQKDGVRLYDLARQGIEVERPAKQVTVYKLELISYDEQSGEGVLKVKCSKGTYIRTIIADVGDSLGCGAVMTSLRRTMAAGFNIDDAMSLEQAQKYCDDNTLANNLMPIERAFELYDCVKVTPAQAKRFVNGGELALDRVTLPCKSDIYRVKCRNEFLGLGIIKNNNLAVYRLFYSGGGWFENYKRVK